MPEFTHLSDSDHPKMVDVSQKAISERKAIAQAVVCLGNELYELLTTTGSTKKGPVLQTAIIAGIQGAKKTADLIPMCHPLPLTGVNIDISFSNERAYIKAEVKTTGNTGVEMEALTAATTTALTLYDMCKSVSKSITFENVRLLEKSGGKSGDFKVSS